MFSSRLRRGDVWATRTVVLSYFLLNRTRPSLGGVLPTIHGTLAGRTETLSLSIRVDMRNKITIGLVVQQQASNGSEQQLLRLKS